MQNWGNSEKTRNLETAKNNKKKVIKCEENQKILKPQKTQNYGENYKIGEKWGKCKIWENPKNQKIRETKKMNEGPNC